MKKRSFITLFITLLILLGTNKLWLNTTPEIKTLKNLETHSLKSSVGGGGKPYYDRVTRYRFYVKDTQSSEKLQKISIKFEFEIFIIILILSTLFSYKLLDYLADFKIEKHYSRIDIVFLAICALIMYIPMSNISDVQKSKTENRNLAPWKPLINENGKINYNFGKNYDNWFNDRFNGRKVLMPIISTIKYNLSEHYYSNGDSFINKDNNWIFWYSRFKDIQFGEAEIATYLYSLQKLEEFCKANNIDLYIMPVPCKEYVYFDMAAPIVDKPGNGKDFKFLYEQLNKNRAVNISYPIDEFISLKNSELLYYKTDHHWSDFGAFIGYNYLMDRIISENPRINKLREKDFDITYQNVSVGFGSMYRGLKIKDKKIYDTNYRFYKGKSTKNLSENFERISKTPLLEKFEFYNPEAINSQRVCLLGDSFGEAIINFFSITFKDTMRIYTNTPKGTEYTNFNMKRFENIIKDFKPDILIICVSESGYNRLNYLYRQEYLEVGE